MNIALYGGTFDPPTTAHRFIVESLASDDRYDEVWIMPSADRLDKPHMTSSEHRMKMVQEMAREIVSSKVVVSDFEIQIGEPTQTRRTYAELKQKYPQHTFWFVFGADSYNDMPTWEEGKKLRESLSMCIIPRIGYKTPKQQHNVHVHPVPDALELATSSTYVRTLAHERRDIRRYVGNAVTEYVLSHSLYV